MELGFCTWFCLTTQAVFLTNAEPSVVIRHKADQRQGAMRRLEVGGKDRVTRGAEGGWVMPSRPKSSTFEGSRLFRGFCQIHILQGIGKENVKGVSIG